MNTRRSFLIAAVLGIAGCEATDLNQILGPLGLGRRIEVVSATYGQNCGAPAGNVTSHVAQACSGATSKCDYRIDVNTLGDPKRGCAKAFEVQYQCTGGATQTVSAPPEADTKTVTLQCTV